MEHSQRAASGRRRSQSVRPTTRRFPQFAALAALYLPGPFAGYVFGMLVEAIGRSTAWRGAAADRLRVDASLWPSIIRKS